MAFSFFKKKDKQTESNSSGSHKTQYYKLKIREVVKETADAISIVFENPPSGKMQYKAGQFLTLILPIEGKSVRRAYSLCSSPYVDEYPAVAIKRVEGGLVSNYLNDHAKAGDEIEIMEPMGNFTTEIEASKKRHLIMFAGGSGITPMMDLVQSLLSQESESIASLIYANRNEHSIIFQDKIKSLQASYGDRLHVHHVLDEAPMNWQGPSGLLNPGIIKELFAQIPDWGADKTTYLMCGPEGMMVNVETILTSMNIAKDRIFKESFVSGTINKEEKVASTSGAHTVKILYDGEEYEIEVAADSTILETALDQDIDLPFSCLSGLCTACSGICTSGQVKMTEEEGLSASEQAAGYVLTCEGHKLTDDVVIEIGKSPTQIS